MKYYIQILLWTSTCLSSFGQSMQDQELDVYLLGNISQLEHPEEYAIHLRKLLDESEDWTLVLNGDLLNEGVSLNASLSTLDYLIRTLAEGNTGQILLIPGDKDWGDGSVGGLAQLRILQSYIEDKDYDHVYFPIQDGCPGPYLFPAGDNLRLLLINTQWINHPFAKPTSESAVCDIATEDAFLEEIESMIEDNGQANLMVIGHHPLISNGRIGGAFPFTDWWLPLPGIGLFTTSFRQNIGSDQDIVNERFDDFRHKLNGQISGFSSVIYASGHAQNIEIFRNEDNVYLNSGAPLSGKFVRKNRSTIFASRSAGIVKTRYSYSGQVEAYAYLYDETSGFAPLDSSELFQAPCLEPKEGIPMNSRLIPCRDVDQFLAPSGPQPSFEVMAANPNYKIGKTGLKLLGKHYRNSWTTPVKVPVLDLEEYAGGLDPTEIGGGRQTKSLKFKSNTGLEYVFRSVDKDPSKALAWDLRGTVVALLLGDQTTTQQPYGAAPASKLLDHLDILHARPKLFVMPNSDLLGHFNAEFKGMLGLIEERPTDPIDGISFAKAKDVKRSLSLFRRMYRDRDYKIVVPEFVRARIFDILVGDWGKHEDNWKWAGYKTDKGFTYRPIPRDRDHVFSRWDGFLPWLADREWAKPSGENFDHKIKGLRSLMWQARHLDRFVASEADRETWLTEAKMIQSNLNDQLIDEAITALPEEIIEVDGKEIGEKLKTRLKDLDRYAMSYYEMLAREVDVVGSNKHERFEVNRLAGGDVRVRMYKIRKKQKDELYYERLFKPDETREIRLFGMDGNDQFLVEGVANKSILTRIVPGMGMDSINDQSRVIGARKHSILYGETSDVVESGKELRIIKGFDYHHYRYERTGFKYNTYFPIAYVFFSSDLGLSLNGNVLFTRHKFGKPDFASTHRIGSSVSSIGNFRVNYEGAWRHFIGTLDLIGGLSFQNKRRYRYFFGLGNETTFDQDLLNDDFYTLQYSSAQAFIGLQKSFWKRSHLNLSGLVELNSGQKLQNTILQNVDLLGENKLEIAKLKLELDLDFRDRANLPMRGARFFSTNQLASPFDGNLESYAIGESRIEYFLTVKPFTLGVRGGLLYSHRDVPYYDLPTLGQNRYLRGFRRNRFAGEQAGFINSELRIELVNKPKALLPNKFGLRFFLDRSRVSLSGEGAKEWRQGYGVGAYYVPIREQFSLHLSFAFSEEEKGLVIFGFGNSF